MVVSEFHKMLSDSTRKLFLTEELKAERAKLVEGVATAPNLQQSQISIISTLIENAVMNGIAGNVKGLEGVVDTLNAMFINAVVSGVYAGAVIQQKYPHFVTTPESVVDFPPMEEGIKQ